MIVSVTQIVAAIANVTLPRKSLHKFARSRALISLKDVVSYSEKEGKLWLLINNHKNY